MSVNQVLGVYKAIVKRNDDPTSSQRLILLVPQVLGTADSAWADPSDPTSVVPALGDAVWVQFNGGDVTKPMYVANGLRQLADSVTAIIDSVTSGVLKDTTFPKKPTALSATSSVVYSVEGIGTADLVLTWTPPSFNVGESNLTDLQGYIVAWSYDNLNWSGGAYAQNATWTFHTLWPGTLVYFSVTAFDTGGNASEAALGSITTTISPGAPAGSVLYQNAIDIIAAQNAVTTAVGRIDGKASIWMQPTAPTGLLATDEGDIWINTTTTDNTFKSWKWNSPTTGVGAWVDITNTQSLSNLAAIHTKSTTYYGGTFPATGAPTPPLGGFSLSDLWLDINNRLARWDGTAWVDAQDKAIATATTTATAADGKADAALLAANGKNTNTFSLNPPGTTANVIGDIWWQKDAYEVLIGQWEGKGGTAWLAKTIGSTVIGNLDAGKITTGYLNANRLSATAIDGKTITGSIFQTAWSGQRWVIGSYPSNVIDAYSGSAYETSPGALTIAADYNGRGSVSLVAPGTSYGVGGGLTLKGPDPGTGNNWTYAELAGSNGSVGVAGTQGVRWIAQGPRGGGATYLDGDTYVGDITVSGKVRGQPYTVTGSAVATPTTGGAIALDYGVTFTTAPYPTVCSGAGAIICSGVSINGSSGQAILYSTTGAAITTGSRRVNFTVSGILA